MSVVINECIETKPKERRKPKEYLKPKPISILKPLHVNAHRYPCHVEKENGGDRPAKYTRLPKRHAYSGVASVPTIAILGVSKQPATATSGHPEQPTAQAKPPHHTTQNLTITNNQIIIDFQR